MKNLILLSTLLGCAQIKDVLPKYDLTSEDLKEMKLEFKRPEKIPYPKSNPYTKSKAILGKKLFFEKKLSLSGNISCATCHDPSKGFEDGLSLGVGHNGSELDRHSPTTINLAWGKTFFWDGRSPTLEDQALMPIMSSVEMALPLTQMISVLKNEKEYISLFRESFKSTKITQKKVAKAIATYERGLVNSPAPFDKWINGDESAIDINAKRGFVIFNTKANCVACHEGWRFTDDSFHDIGINTKDRGRGKLQPKLKKMQFAFKTPGLRNIVERAPYTHNGSLNSLKEVIDFYDRGGDIKRKSLSGEIKKLNLTEQEKNDLVSFLKTLSSPIEENIK